MGKTPFDFSVLILAQPRRMRNGEGLSRKKDARNPEEIGRLFERCGLC
jgi:hypothetical protein